MKLFAENLTKISESDIKYYTKLKETSDIKAGDYVLIFDDIYAQIGKGNLLVKEKVNKYNTILRKK